MEEVNQHTKYFNKQGAEVPSVTTILKILDKPALQVWSNYLGKMNKDVNVELNRFAQMGTLTHKYIEEYINHVVRIFYPMNNDIQYRAIIAYGNFLHYMRDYGENIIFLKSEMKLTSDLFGGTIDCYCKFNEKYRLMDFKTSNDIHMSQFLQLAGYIILLEENGYQVDEVSILALNKAKVNTYKTKVRSRDEMQPYVETYKILIELYHKLQVIS